MERNGNGIFYGVIGVATLVVAIIGATFAYFSAQTGTNTPFNTAAASIDLTWSEQEYFHTNLIPVETGDEDPALATKFAGSSSVGAGHCQDINNNAICSMYQFTVGNPNSSTANQQVYASITASVNTIENLMFAIFEGTPAEIDASTDGWNVNGDVAANGTTTNLLRVKARAMASGRITELDQVLDPGETHTYTVIMWIEETGSAQKQGGQLTARIDFTTENAGQGVTGLLAA